jgi:hypothetical protein
MHIAPRSTDRYDFGWRNCCCSARVYDIDTVKIGPGTPMRRVMGCGVHYGNPFGEAACE